jgi:hypothetical protein
MILNKELIEKKQLGEALNYVYPMSFNGEEKYGVIRIVGTSTDREIQVYITDDKATLKKEEGEIFQTNDIKKAWEKFEDLFNESDEGQQQGGGEEPEVANLFLTFPLSGQAKLFIQNQKGQQKVLMEFEITDTDLILKQPRFYTLDFTDDENMPEQVRTKWAMANTNGDVSLEGTTEDYITYQVAILSIAPPDGHNPPQPPSDEMEFYRLIQYVGGVALLKKFIFNKKTNEITFVENTGMPATENNGDFDVNIEGMSAKLRQYPSLDEGVEKAYVLVVESENPQPSEEFPFYRLVSFVGGVLNLKLHSLNLKTKEETFVQQEQMNGEDKTDYFEIVIDGQVLKLMPYPTLDKDSEKAYVMIMEGQDPPPPQPPQPPQPPMPPSDEMEFFRLISDMGSSIVVSQNVYNKKTEVERMIRTLTYTSTPKGRGFEIEIEGEIAKLAPYPKLDANGQNAYVMVTKGKGKNPDDEEEDRNVFTFFRLQTYDGLSIFLKQYTLNRTTQTETFDGDLNFPAEDKGGYFESTVDGEIVRFGRVPEYDKDGLEAYVAVKRVEKSEDEDEPIDEEPIDEPIDDDDDGESQPEPEESDKGGSGRRKSVTPNEIISRIADETGEDPNSIIGSFRSERFLESYLRDKKVNLSDLGTKLNLPTTMGALVKEIIKIVNQN